jgi:glycosyltransferase involved in cell wall biosynthesis
VSLFKGVPFIFELRDLWPESIVAVGAMKRNFIIRFFEKVALFLYKRSALIISLTDSFKEYLIKRGIDAKKIAVIKNGVELDNFKREKISVEKCKNDFGVEGKKVISYIGTLGMAHALDKVLDCAKALETMEDIQFLIVGSGAEKDKLEGKKRTENIHNVTFVGQVNKEAVKKYYAISDIGLVTLKKDERFSGVIPSKIFEYMAMEVPIIISVDGEARQIVEESGGGIYVEPENVEQMTEVIKFLIQNQENMTEMGRKARMYVERNFNRKELAQKQLDVIKSFMSTVSGKSLRESPLFDG